MATPPSATGSKPTTFLPTAVQIAVRDINGDGAIDVVYGATEGGTIHDFTTRDCFKLMSGKKICEDNRLVMADLSTDNGRDFGVTGTNLFDANGTITRAQQLIGKNIQAVKKYEEALIDYRKNGDDLKALALVMTADRAGLGTSVPKPIAEKAALQAIRLLAQLVRTDDANTLKSQGTVHFQQASRVLALTGGEVKFDVDGTTYSSLAQIRDKVFENMGGGDSNTAKAFLADANRAIEGSKTPPRATATEK